MRWAFTKLVLPVVCVGIFGGCTLVAGPSADLIAAPSASTGPTPSAMTAASSWNQVATVLPDSDPWPYGLSSQVAVDGPTMVVGLPESAVTGNLSQGTAYVFSKTSTGWSRVATLTAPDGGPNDQFGIGVTASRTTITVSALGHVVGGNHLNGVVYVYDQIGNGWVLTGILPIGGQVAKSGNTIAIGDSNQDAVFVFTHQAGQWTQTATLRSSDWTPAQRENFGGSVSISGSTIAVGASLHPVGPNLWQGAVYTFAKSTTGWTQTAKLLAPDGQGADMFGRSVVLRGNALAVGAPASNFRGFTNPLPGAVYVFTNNTPSGWSLSQKLVPADGQPGDNFGSPIAMSNGTLIVGVVNHSNLGAGRGVAYVFDTDATTRSWSQSAELVPSDGTGVNSFGSSVGLSGSTAVIGSIRNGQGAVPVAFVYART